MQLKTIVQSWKNDTEKSRRVIVFGSSTSTQKFENGRLAWGNWLGVTLNTEIGWHVHTMVRGVGGENVLDLKKRVDRDVLSYNPDLVIITVGGNDARDHLTDEEYRSTLHDICLNILSCGGEPVLQTYFHPLTEEYEEERRNRLLRFMQYMRDIAEELDLILIDHMKVFGSFYYKDPDEYSKLFRDLVHLNGTGQIVAGYSVCRAFGLETMEIPEDEKPFVLNVISKLEFPEEIRRSRK